MPAPEPPSYVPAGGGDRARGAAEVIVAERLVKRYGARVAVDGVSLSVRAGELVALLGPNGAGKTTTVELLLGMRRPDGGTVRLLGADLGPGGWPAALRARLGVLLQDGAVPSGLTVAEAVRLHAAFHADPADPGELLERLGLVGVAKVPYRRLSGGLQQRLQLALALIGRPRALFLDEPTAGLDPAARATTWELVRQLAGEGATVLLTTQLIEEAERVAERVVILDHGRVVAAGTPAELTRAASARQLTFRAAKGIDEAALGAALGAPVEVGPVPPSGDTATYRVLADPDPTLVARLAAWLSARGTLLEELHVGGGTLEQVFLSLTRAGAAAERAGGREAARIGSPGGAA
jgi:ABC-2 type transport system ATP-binding protein